MKETKGSEWKGLYKRTRLKRHYNEKTGVNSIKYPFGYRPPAINYDLTTLAHGTTDNNQNNIYNGHSFGPGALITLW